MKKLLMMAFIALAMMTSCSQQDDINNVNGDTMNVSLKVSQTPLTRAIGGSNVPTGSKTAIENGTLFFFNGNGTVVYKYTLDIAGADGAVADGGAIIKDVPSTATSVAMIANSAADFSSTTPSSFNDFKAISFKIWNQASMAGIVGNASLMHPNAVKSVALLDGAGNSIPNPITKTSGAGYNAVASIQLTPAVARIEIPANSIKIAQADDVENPIKLTAFDLVGVYINNFYLTRNLSLTSSDFTGSIGGDWASTLNTVGTGYKALATSVSPAVTMFDEFNSTPISTIGGNVFMSYHVMPADGEANLPHIIIAGKNFVLDGHTPSVPTQYWKVTSYKYASPEAATANGEPGKLAGDAVAKFNPAKVYVVSGLTFGKNYPRDEPYEDNLTVEVTITVQDWVEVPIVAEPK